MKVTIELLDQGVDPGKGLNVAQPREKVNLKCLSVDRPVEVQQVDFDLQGPLAEGRVGAKVDGGGKPAVPAPGPSGVDAKGRQQRVDRIDEIIDDIRDFLDSN